MIFWGKGRLPCGPRRIGPWIGGLFDVLMPAAGTWRAGVAARCPKFSPEPAPVLSGTAMVRNVFLSTKRAADLKAEGAEIARPAIGRIGPGAAFGGKRWPGVGAQAFGPVVKRIPNGQNRMQYGRHQRQQPVFPPRPDVSEQTCFQAMMSAVLDVGWNPTKDEANVGNPKGSASCAGLLQRPDETAQKISRGWNA